MLLSSIEDKISACFSQGITQFSDFLTLEEADATEALVRDVGLYFSFFGGYEDAERRMVALSISQESTVFPITVLCGKWDRFAEISHRDILGGLMAGGIERKCIGDILVDREQRRFFVFSVERMADYLVQNISRIGRCTIVWEQVSYPAVIPQGLTEQKRLPVSSLRVDTVIAAVWHLSRQKAQDLVTAKKVFVDHRLVIKNTQLLQAGCSVVVRGLGKFLFLEENGLSKKGKTYILIKQYL